MTGKLFRNKKAVSPVIAIVLLLMMTVAAAGAAYFWLTQMQSSVQEQSTESIENIMQQSGRKLMAQAAICEPTAPEGMVAWYEFEKGEGDQVHDSSKNSNNGTIYGANWTEGKAGNALEFDGSDDYVGVLSGNFNISKGDTKTFSVWVFPRQIGSADHRWYPGITCKDNNAGSWDSLISFANGTSWQWGTAKFGFVTRAQNHTIIPSDEGLERETHKWYHIMIIFDGLELRYYVNGESLGKGSLDNWNYLPLNYLGLGYAGATNDGHLDGLMDELRIYDRVLSTEEINETYKGKMKVKVTVRNIGSVSIPKAEFVANLKQDGTTVDSDTYVTESSIDTDELKTLTFYFNEMRPGGSYNVNIPGIDVSQSVSCQSLES